MARGRNIQKKTQGTNKKLFLTLPIGVKIKEVIGIDDVGQLYKLQIAR